MPLCKSSKSTDQRLEAMKWYFGARHCRKITFSDDTAGDQGGDSFDLNVIDSSYAEKKYLIWLNDGVASAPTPASDQTLIGVSYTQGDLAAVIAAAVEAQLIADSVEVRMELVGADLEIQNHFVGAITAEVIANAPDLVASIEKIGFGGYIGQTGESELTTTVEVVQLLDDANGTVPLSEVITGYLAEITIPLREMTTQRWEDLIGAVTGNTITIGSKDITGWGTKKLYNDLFSYSGRLIGHPVRLDNSNIDEDIVMLSTAPKMNSINFSGGSVQEAEFLFTSYKNANAPEEINLLARGDHSLY